MKTIIISLMLFIGSVLMASDDIFNHRVLIVGELTQSQPTNTLNKLPKFIYFKYVNDIQRLDDLWSKFRMDNPTAKIVYLEIIPFQEYCNILIKYTL